MDIVVQQPNTSQNFELDDELLYTVNDMLQKLISRVENILSDTEYMACSSSELPDIDTNEREKKSASKQGDIVISPECTTVPSTGQSDLTIKKRGYYHKKFHDFFKSAECDSSSSSILPIVRVEEEQTFCEEKNEDLIISAENMISHDIGQSLLNIKEGEKYRKDSQDIEPLNEYFEDVLEKNEYSDVNRMNPIRVLSPIYECISSDDTWSSKEDSSTTEASFDDMETSIDSFYFDDEEEDEEFAVPQPSKEVGDQEEDLDNRTFFERVVQYVRETDMLLNANRGGGDHVNFDIHDDSDNESVNDMFE